MRGRKVLYIILGFALSLFLFSTISSYFKTNDEFSLEGEKLYGIENKIGISPITFERDERKQYKIFIWGLNEPNPKVEIVAKSNPFGINKETVVPNKVLKKWDTKENIWVTNAYIIPPKEGNWILDIYINGDKFESLNIKVK
jgi:hypothetical protein